MALPQNTSFYGHGYYGTRDQGRIKYLEDMVRTSLRGYGAPVVYDAVVQLRLSSVNGQPTGWHNMLHSVNITTNQLYNRLLQPVLQCCKV